MTTPSSFALVDLLERVETLRREGWQIEIQGFSPEEALDAATMRHFGFTAEGHWNVVLYPPDMQANPDYPDVDGRTLEEALREALALVPVVERRGRG